MEYSFFLAWFLPRVLAVGVAEDDVADRDKTFWDLPFFTERKAYSVAKTSSVCPM
jgi:hypothetical protein